MFASQKSTYFATCMLLLIVIFSSCVKKSVHIRQGDYEIGCYYFPNYHVDPYNEIEHGPGWTEWELMKHATPRFEGHDQPKVPLWGYEDEADPRVMEKKIQAAAGHGIDFFIFDWYYYDNHEFLNRCLDTGYFGASNHMDVPFCLMWANHNWRELFPVKFNVEPRVIWPGHVSAKEFDRMTDLVIEKYFKHPAYYTIDGCPYFSIFSLKTFLRGFDSLQDAAKAVRRFREKTKAAGFPDLHFNIISRRHLLVGDPEIAKLFQKQLNELDAQSTNTYNMAAFETFNDFPSIEYASIVNSAETYWRTMPDRLDQEYFPTISVGWDVTPRITQSDRFVQKGYPFSAVYINNNPDHFKSGLIKLKQCLDDKITPNKIGIINAWNEWTEGSYLEPDTRYGMGHLEAVRDVFGIKTK